jgi:hypothetical protein
MPKEASNEPRILQVPLPGGSGCVPSGAMQFRDDWPGLFLRGDDALMVGFAIRRLEKALAASEDPIVWSALMNLTAIAASLIATSR